MFVIVLTGGIGSGKSVAADYFRSRGASLLGLDEAAHRLLETDADIHDAVVDAFGTEVLAPDGSIDRRKLASAAFGSPERAACLNGIVHPALATKVQTELLEMRSSSASPRVLVLEVPLLVEAPVFVGSADSVLAISAAEGRRSTGASMLS